MQKRLLRWELIGFAFTGAVGTLLHFVYELSLIHISEPTRP